MRRRGQARRTSDRAAEQLRELFPTMGPWTSAALWHGRAEPAQPPDTPIADELEALTDQRLAGLALQYVADAGVTIPAEVRRQLQQSAFDWTAMTHRALRRAPDALSTWTVDPPAFAVSKGPGIARHYARIELRPFSDIDILVSEDAFDGWTRRLEADAWYEEARNRQPWEVFRRYCREGLNLSRDDGGRIDVHHRIPPWLWAEGIDVPSMLRRSVPVPVLDTEFRCLSDTDNLLVAALHIVSDRNTPGQSLLVWRDIVELANAAPAPDVVLRAAEVGLTGWLRAVLQALPEPFGTQDLLAALGPGAELQHPRRLALLLSPRPARWGVLATQALRLPLRNGLVFALGMLVPSPAFLRARFPDQRHRYRRWWRRAGESHLPGRSSS